MNDNTIIEWLPYAKRAAYGFWLKNRSLDIDDLESAATYAVVESIQKYDGSTPFDGFCRTRIGKRLIDAARRINGRKSRKRRPLTISIDVNRSDESSLASMLVNTSCMSAAHVTTADILDDILSQLSRREKSFLVMRLHGESVREIANVFGLSEQRCWQIWRDIAVKIAERFGVPVPRVANCFNGRKDAHQ